MPIVRLQNRRDTSANWTTNNPTLSSGEIGFETNTGKLKIGDGSTAWNSLSYFADPLGLWNFLVTTWSVTPTSLGTISGGEVFSYTYGATTRYRFVPSPYDPDDDAFYGSFVSSVLGNFIVSRGG